MTLMPIDLVPRRGAKHEVVHGGIAAETLEHS